LGHTMVALTEVATRNHGGGLVQFGHIAKTCARRAAAAAAAAAAGAVRFCRYRFCPNGELNHRGAAG
jgi:hypothetical protein